jgi:hypothetical protein
MKTQAYPRTFLASVLVLSLWMASGCANKSNVAEDGEQTENYSENASDPGAAPQEGEAAAAEGETTAQEAELFGEGEQKTADATTQGDPAMDSLFDANSQDPNAGGEPNFDELAGKTAGSETAPADAATSPTPSASESPVASTPINSEDPLLSQKSSEPLADPASSSSAQAFSNNASFSGKSYAGAVVPNIPERAIVKKGKSLNRYYFLRSGDNAAKVSELVYGDKSHASDLKKWNKGNWKPGKVVYYASPAQPDDAQMVSFYDERGLAPDQHTVGKGETMSTIAKDKLGSAASWKELAVVNGLSSPDTLRRGQTIKVFSNLGSPNVVAETPAPEVSAPATAPQAEPAQAPVAAQPPAPENTAGNPADMGAMAPMAQDPVTEDLNKPKRKNKKDGLNLAKLVSQNSFTLVLGLGVGLLLVSLMMINKRKRAGGAVEEFGEDAFAAPKKKRR